MAYEQSPEIKSYLQINKVGKAISIQDLMKENPQGKNTRIIG